MKKFVLSAALFFSALAGNAEAVSYTHLDVYKRQLRWKLGEHV